MTGRIFDIEHASFVDGPGIRTAVFFKGCNLRCAWCHNPESQSCKKQLMVYRDKCINCGKCSCDKEICDLCGKCVLACPVSARRIVGEDMTVEQIMEQILRDSTFFGTDGGVTFTGGECMLQLECLETLLKMCRERGIHTAVDTAGNVPWKAFKRILPYTDLFLYDLKVVEPDLHKKYTGADNGQILGNLSRLLQRRVRVWIRIPVIPNVNDSVSEMETIKALLQEWGMPERVELLAYHTMGENKYAALGQKGTQFPVPPKEKMAQLTKIFE